MAITAGKQIRIVTLMIVFAGHSAVTSGTSREGLQLQPGRYAVTVTYSVQEQRQSQSRFATRCIAPGDLGNPERIFSDAMYPSALAEESCSVAALSAVSGKISYDAGCSNRFVHVAGTAGGTEFSVVRSVRPKASGKVSLKLTIRGRRIGDCRGDDGVANPSPEINGSQPGAAQ